MASSTVAPAVLRAERCFCGASIELRDYADRHLPARWYNAGTDRPHSCPRKPTTGPETP